MKIPSIIVKNLKVLFRHKISLFILFLGPILIIIILGIIFNSQSIININIGYYIENDTTLNAQYVDNLELSNYKLIEYTSKQQCINNIESGLNHVCIFFLQTENDSSFEQVEISVDTSRSNLVYIIENLLISSFEVQTEKIQLNNTKTVLNVVNMTENENIKNKKVFENIENLTTILRTNHQKLKVLTEQLNVTFNPNYFDTDSLQGSTQQIDETIFSLTAELESILDDIDSSTSSISSSLNSANFSSEEDENIVNTEIDELENQFEQMSLIINQLKNEEDTEAMLILIDNINKLINKIDEDINNIISNLNEISSNIENVENRLSSDLYNLQESNNKILNSINSIPIRNAELIISPINIQIQSVVPESKSNLNSSFPSIISTLIFIVSILLSSNFILAEKTSKAYFRNFLSKASSTKFFLGNFLTLFLILFAQLTILLVFYYLLFQQGIDIRFIAIIITIIPIIALFILLGMIIGYISNNQSVNIIISFIVITILISLSGFLIPIEILSSEFVFISLLNPYLISTAILRKIIIFNIPLFDIIKDFTIIMIYITILFLIGLMLESLNNKRTIYKYYYIYFEKIKDWKNKVIKKVKNYKNI